MSLRMDEDRPDEEQSAQVQDDTFYALLNVPRDASTDLIKEKYRQLAILLHPDKQHDEHRRATANDRFQRLKRAYEVLSDPHLRAVYDALGEEGIRYAGEISRKYKSAEEIIAGIERLARKSGVRDTPTTSDTVVIGVDARTLTVPTSHIVPGARTPTFLDRLHGIEVSNFSVRHALHASVAPSTKLSLAARTASRATQGSFIGTVRHQFSPRLAVESSIACLHPLFMSIRASYDVDPHTELRLFTRFNSGRSILFPAFSVVVSRVLYPKAIGTVTFNSGWPPLLISNFTNNPPNITTNSSPSSFEIEIKSNPWTVSTVLSGDGNNGSIAIQGAYTYKVTSSTDVSISAVLTIPSGIAFVLTGVQRFGSQSKGAPPTILNVNVLLSMAGIELRIRIARESQVFSIPIKLSDDLSFTLALWTTLIPALGTAALEYFVLHPIRMKESRAAQARARNQDALMRQRLEAEQEVELLREQITKRVEAEQKINGLIILNARYGSSRVLKAHAGSGSAEATNIVDVTIACQALVHNSQLSIPGGRSKALLVGFYDPCYGEPKALHIRYSFKGKIHLAEVEDLAALKAPIRGHLIS